jgi:hypothetical protein
VVLGRHVKSLEFFDVLFGDRPALSAVESFYQRVLADNPDEALAQAETLLADRPLIDYYDEVVLAGLKLAAEDEARGTINRDRAQSMSRTMMAVIDDLHDHDDSAVDPGRGALPELLPVAGGTVACIAGRGPFDEGVSAMLAQLLAQQQVDVRRIGHDAVSREAIGGLDLSGVSVLVLSYIELAGTPAHLRYLIRRLRQRAPGATVIVGLWPEGEEVLANPDLQRAAGADQYVRSLREAVETARAALAAEPIAKVA